MLKSQSQLIKIQPFLQSLRTSMYPGKDNCNHEYSQQTGSEGNGVVKDEKVGRKSLSKPKTLTFNRKTSINTGKQKLNHKCFYHEGYVDICFNKILKKTSSYSQLHAHQHEFDHSDSFIASALEILILFTKSETKDSIKGLTKEKVKLTITPTQISLQDQSKVKRSFSIDLQQKMDQMNCLRINVPKQFKPESVFLNGKILLMNCQFSQNVLMSQKICVLNPWQLINQQKTLLQNKILSTQRPKSKIKWNLQFKENDQQINATKIFTKRDQNKRNYGMTSPEELTSRPKNLFKSRTNLNIHTNQTEKNKFCNVFKTPVKTDAESNSMSSTFQSVKDSDQKKVKSSFFTEKTDRKNNIIQTLKFKVQKRRQPSSKNIEETQSLTVRPKSSFKNLKEKNEYFQMRQSERKKSIKKDIQDYVMNDEVKISQKKISPKSSEIQAEYGL